MDILLYDVACSYLQAACGSRRPTATSPQEASSSALLSCSPSALLSASPGVPSLRRSFARLSCELRNRRERPPRTLLRPPDVDDEDTLSGAGRSSASALLGVPGEGDR
jgi:hypothetical protein